MDPTRYLKHNTNSNTKKQLGSLDIADKVRKQLSMSDKKVLSTQPNWPRHKFDNTCKYHGCHNEFYSTLNKTWNQDACKQFRGEDAAEQISRELEIKTQVDRVVWERYLNKLKRSEEQRGAEFEEKMAQLSERCAELDKLQKEQMAQPHIKCKHTSLNSVGMRK